MFSCCQEPLECWATFSSLFHRRYSKETALLAAPETVDNQEDGQMNGPFDPPISISKELKSSLKHNTTITATLTSEERDKLSQILALLQKKYETVTLASSEEMKDTLDSNFEKGTNASHESSYSFLYELGLAASEVTLQTEQAASPISSGDNYLSYGENPEAAIQQLLQAGKQTELLRERQRKHIRLLQCLEKEFPKLLSPLRHCWSDLERSLKDTANDIIQQQQIFGQISSVLLGCRGVPDTLKLLWKVLDKEMEEYEIQSSEDKIYNLIRLCFRFAVVQTFLTTKVEDDKRQEQLKSSINALLQNNSEPGNTRDCAIQTMVDSFWNFSKKNQYSEIEQKDDTALQLLFQQWLEIHAPSLLSSLSMCMKAVFFPSLSEESSNAEEDTGWLLPRLDKETTDSLLFSSTSGPVSPWLYAVACTMPLHHHKNVGTTVCYSSVVCLSMFLTVCIVHSRSHTSFLSCSVDAFVL